MSDLFEPIQPTLRQGDIFGDIPMVWLEHKGDSRFQPELGKLRPAILLSHSCDIDKETNKRLLVSPVMPIMRLSKKMQDNVRRNRVFSFFHLPHNGEALGESFVDLTHIVTIDKAALRTQTRLCSLSEQGRRGLYTQWVRAITRWELATISCPNCSVTFDSGEILPVNNL